MAMSSAASSVDRLNHINSGLMIAAAAVAWMLPFEVFALAYVVLGPLHYLTQISWLHDRRFFSRSRYDALVLAGAAAIATFGFGLDRWLHFNVGGTVIVGSFLGAAALLLVANPLARLALFAAGLGLAYLAREMPATALLAVMLPTVIHVFVFTEAFVLQGALRSERASGLISFAVFVACAALLLSLQPSAHAYVAHQGLRALIAPFDDVRIQLSRLVGLDTSWDATVAATRFLGWAYTYHYLNWFSKTRLIGWHRIGRARAVGIGLVYAAALGLYAWNYTLGFLLVGFIGMIHVFTEFPLDVKVLGSLPGLVGRRARRSA
jgi:hypothetical protein